MLKPVFNVESTKECMSILLLSNWIFQLWKTILVEWENCNIGRKWRCVDSSSSVGWKINVWLPFEHERKATKKASSKSFGKNHHYPWSSNQGGWTTWLKVNAQVYQAFEEKGHHSKWNYDSFQISKTNYQ